MEKCYLCNKTSNDMYICDINDGDPYVDMRVRVCGKHIIKLTDHLELDNGERIVSKPEPFTYQVVK